MARFPPDTELEKHIHSQCANIRVLLQKKSCKIFITLFLIWNFSFCYLPVHKWDNSEVTYSRRPPGFLILHSTLDPTISVYT